MKKGRQPHTHGSQQSGVRVEQFQVDAEKACEIDLVRRPIDHVDQRPQQQQKNARKKLGPAVDNHYSLARNWHKHP